MNNFDKGPIVMNKISYDIIQKGKKVTVKVIKLPNYIIASLLIYEFSPLFSKII